MEEFTICSNVSWLYHFLEQKLHLCSMLSVTSYQARLCSGDGFSVSLPAHLLLASNWVARNTFILGQAGQDVFLPSVRGSTLLLLVEILRSGKTSNLAIMDNLSYRLKEVQEVMMLLDIPGCIALTREDGSEMKTKLKILPKYQVRIEKVSAPLVSSVNHAKEEISCTLNPEVKVTKIKGMPNFLESGPSPLMLDNQDYTEIKIKGEEYIVAETSGLEEDNLIKISVKIGMLQRGDKFSVEERSSLALIQTTLRTVAKTLISFHQVDHTYDRLFLVKFLTELETLLKDLIRPHLTEKSVGRVEQIFGVVKTEEFLDQIYQPKLLAKHPEMNQLMEKVVQDLTACLDAGTI